MSSSPDAVRVEGLAELRRDLRRMQSDAVPEVRKALKDAAEIVAARGAVNAPRGTRPIPSSRRPRVRLAASLRPGTSGNAAVVRSRLPYGLKIERSTGFLSRALSESEDRIVESIGDSIDRLAVKHGW